MTKARKLKFSLNDFVVYPTHGVGKIVGIENQEIVGTKLKVFVISFEKDKMTLRVPVGKTETTGMRELSTPNEMKVALKMLKGRARVRRTTRSAVPPSTRSRTFGSCEAMAISPAPRSCARLPTVSR